MTPPVEPTLREILGGRSGAVDASLPALSFVVAYAVVGLAHGAAALPWAAGSALVVAAVVAVLRLARGGRPRAVVLGLLGVSVAALVALYTGRAVDFFAVQIATNAASTLVWAASIVIRWPLLGVIVGVVLGQRTRWRRDPELLRAYQRASWVWVVQYVVRLVVFIPLYLVDAVVALGLARVLLTWPLVAACVAVSWVVLRRALPADHPGLRRPRERSGAAG